jgi:effector-binding domain-containing protein
VTTLESHDQNRIVEQAAQPTVAVRIRQPMAQLDLSSAFDRYPAAIGDLIRERGASVTGPLFGRYHTYGPEHVDVEIGFPVAGALTGLPALSEVSEGEIGASELPGGPVAILVHPGSYDGLGAAYEALHDWIHAQPGYDDGPGPWESYVVDPGSVANEADLRTEITWPLRRI